MTVELRIYQKEMVAEARQTLAGGRKRVLLQAPTGAGKTIVFAHIAHRVAQRDKRVVILVHRAELVRQTVDKLRLYGVEPDLITAGTRDVARGHVAVASVQTLVRRLHQYQADYWDLIVVDEAHHAVAGTWAKVLAAHPKAYVLGVTATPERLDGRGLGEAFDELVTGPAVRALIGGGWLADFVCYSHPTGPDLSSVKTRMGDFEGGGLEAAMMRPGLLGDAVEHYAKHLGGKPAIAFATSIKHAEALAAAFTAGGWRAVSVDGTMADADRTARIRGLEDGSVQVLTSCELVSEGLDIPAVAGAILCRPTKSLSVYLQQVGRALRPKDHRAVILDHAGNAARHGLPDTPHDWRLDSKKREPGKALVRVCPACFAAVPAACRVCPECGHVFAIKERKPLGTRNGQLVEMTQWHAGAKPRDCRSWAELQSLAKHLGFKKGWCYHKAREMGWYPIVNRGGYVVGFQPR